MPVASTGAKVSEMWRQINRHIHGMLRKAYKDHPLPYMSWALLRHISRDPGMTVSDLARTLGTAKSHVSNIVDQLVEHNLVQKTTDEDDRRLLRLYPTSKTADVMQNAAKRAEEVWESLRAHMTSEQWADIERSLHVLLAAVNQTLAEVTPGG